MCREHCLFLPNELAGTRLSGWCLSSCVPASVRSCMTPSSRCTAWGEAPGVWAPVPRRLDRSRHRLRRVWLRVGPGGATIRLLGDAAEQVICRICVCRYFRGQMASPASPNGRFPRPRYSTWGRSARGPCAPRGRPQHARSARRGVPRPATHHHVRSPPTSSSVEHPPDSGLPAPGGCSLCARGRVGPRVGITIWSAGPWAGLGAPG